jgi:hypothetical protein
LKKVPECFDKLSMNGFRSITISSARPESVEGLRLDVLIAY